MSNVIGRLLVLLISGWTGTAQAVVIEAGETFTFEFNSLDFTSQGGVSEQRGRVSFIFTDNLFGDPVVYDSAVIKAYEDTAAGVPWYDSGLQGVIPPSSIKEVIRGFPQKADMPLGTWSDLQGVLTWQQLSGSVNLTEITVSVTDYYTTETHTKRFQIGEVPIPAAAWLFGSALLGLVGIKRKTS